MLKIKEIAKERINEEMMVECPYCKRLTLNNVEEDKDSKLFTICRWCWEMIYFDNYDDENVYKKVEGE